VRRSIRNLQFAVLPGLLLILGGSALAQSVEEVRPLEPEHNQTVGVRPTFRLGIEGGDLYKMRFKIVLSQDDFETEAYVFDQMEEQNGWAFENWDRGYGAIYRTRRPIADGEYEWKVYAWNGVSWVEGDDVNRVYIDGVEPAEVELRMEKVRRGDRVSIRLVWDPVYVDLQGRSETVARYHVYRYTKKFPLYARMFEIGLTDDTVFEDDSDVFAGTSMLFYKVTAEDVAGNHPKIRIRHESEVQAERQGSRR
jgi:hypothetical protein